jgi:membrane protease YdiL (CAAX protease family)
VREVIYSGREQNRAQFISQCVSYLLLLALSAKHGKLTRLDFSKMLSALNIFEIALASVLGIALFGFSVGENAAEVWVISKFNEGVAYSMWPFHNNFLTRVIDPTCYFVLMTTIIAPFSEEFYFRGLLFPSLAKSKSLGIAILLNGLIFAMFHPRNIHLISTLIFSSVLCYAYLRNFSLWLCVVTHGAFNLSALLVENYGREFLVRSQNQICSAVEWNGLFFVLFISTSAIVWIIIKLKNVSLSATHCEKN